MIEAVYLMVSELLDFIEVNPKAKPFATVIWLHGLGADGHDFEPILPELKLPDRLPIRFVFPHAPERAVTINAGIVMRAWYDVRGAPGSAEVDLVDFLESVGHLKSLLQHEMQSGMPSERVVLAGFSQGGAIALHTGLTSREKLAGILALSTYLPTADTLAEDASQTNRNTPILMAHGTMDPMIPIGHAIRTRQGLTRLGYRISWHEYPMMHGLCVEEIQDIRSWLLERFDQRPKA